MVGLKKEKRKTGLDREQRQKVVECNCLCEGCKNGRRGQSTGQPDRCRADTKIHGWRLGGFANTADVGKWLAIVPTTD